MANKWRRPLSQARAVILQVFDVWLGVQVSGKVRKRSHNKKPSYPSAGIFGPGPSISAKR